MTVCDLPADKPAPSRMQVRKRNGNAEPVDVNKIVRAVERCAGGLDEIDPMRVATKTISGLYDGATTAELDRLVAAGAGYVESPGRWFVGSVTGHQEGAQLNPWEAR